MIGDVLKQLPGALGRYVGYHMLRLLRIQKSEIPVAVERNAAANSQPKLPERTVVPGQRVDLNPGYSRDYAWPRYLGDTLPTAITSDPLYELWTTTTGGQKWSHYFSIYREIFGQLTGNALRILEIGVYQGASLDLWRMYFSHKDTIIVGIDIHPSCAQFDAPDQGKHVRIGSQTDAKFLDAVVEEFGPFDLIIDDGSHLSGDVIVSFNSLFWKGLKDSGIYFVEDLHASYWSEWRSSANTFFDVCKELVDHMHAHYKVAGPDVFFVEKPADHPIPSLKVPQITAMIREIRFFDSVVAIHKARSDHVPFAVRMDFDRAANFAAGKPA